MTIFHFPQFEHKLFLRYFKRLHIFLAKCGYCVGKWEILEIIAKGVNSETCALLWYWGYHDKSVDEACHLLKWIDWDSFEFRKASCVFGYPLSKPCAFYGRSYDAAFL